MTTSFRIVVVGAGAVGGYYAYKLAQTGCHIAVVCRSDYEIVRKEGFTIQTGGKTVSYRPDEVYKAIETITYQPDLVIVTAKVLPQLDISGLIRPLIGEQTAIALLQNGLNIEVPIKKSFPETPLLSCVTHICATRIGPGHIDHQGMGRVVIGHYPTGEHKLGVALTQRFKEAEVPCTYTVHIQEARWKKLVWNMAFNPLSVLTGGWDTQKLLENTALRTLCERLMNEVCQLAKADGYPLPEEIIHKNIQNTQGLGAYKTSMLIDFEQGRAMEIEAIIGAAIEVAERYKVSIPSIRALYALMQPFKNRVDA